MKAMDRCVPYVASCGIFIFIGVFALVIFTEVQEKKERIKSKQMIELYERHGGKLSMSDVKKLIDAKYAKQEEKSISVTTFMFGVLGSTIFWICYGIVSLPMIVIFMSRCNLAPNGYSILTTGKDRYGDLPDAGEWFIAFFALTTTFILWPIFLVCGIVICVLKFAMPLLLKFLGLILTKTDKLVPFVKITSHE